MPVPVAEITCVSKILMAAVGDDNDDEVEDDITKENYNTWDDEVGAFGTTDEDFNANISDKPVTSLEESSNSSSTTTKKRKYKKNHR